MKEKIFILFIYSKNPVTYDSWRKLKNLFVSIEKHAIVLRRTTLGKNGYPEDILSPRIGDTKMDTKANKIKAILDSVNLK